MPYGYPANPQTLGDHLRKVRMDRRLLQRQVAHLIRTTVANICGWERNRSIPAMKFLPAIIRFLGYDPRPMPETFGQRLAYLRGTRGLSQRVLAKQLHVDTLTLRRWEADQHQPAKQLLRKLERSFPELLGLP